MSVRGGGREPGARRQVVVSDLPFQKRVSMDDAMRVDRLWSIMREIKLCMLVSIDGGLMRARPMMAMPAPEEGAIWFFTDARSHKEDEIASDPRVCLNFEAPNRGLFVSVSGRAALSRDAELIAGKWDAQADAWFPEGPSDKNVRLIRVVPEIAEYWTRPFSLSEVVRELDRARGEGGEADIGENGRVSFG